MAVKIVTDTTADVPPELVARYGITVVPTIIVINGKEYRDGVDMTREEFYKKMLSLRPLPTTAAPASGVFEEVYGSSTDEYLSIHTAKTISGIFNAARIGAEKFGERVQVYDTGKLSFGVAAHVLAAAEAAAQGKNLKEVVATVEAMHPRTRMFALLDTLENLRHSGRLSLMRASIGALLQIKPMFEVADGALLPRAQYRTRTKSVPGFIEFLKTLGRFERMAIVYTDDPTPAWQIREALSAKCDEEPWVFSVTPSIGTNVGPYAVGVGGVLKS